MHGLIAWFNCRVCLQSGKFFQIKNLVFHIGVIGNTTLFFRYLVLLNIIMSLPCRPINVNIRMWLWIFRHFHHFDYLVRCFIIAPSYWLSSWPIGFRSWHLLGGKSNTRHEIGLKQRKISPRSPSTSFLTIYSTPK